MILSQGLGFPGTSQSSDRPLDRAKFNLCPSVERKSLGSRTLQPRCLFVPTLRSSTDIIRLSAESAPGTPFEASRGAACDHEIQTLVTATHPLAAHLHRNSEVTCIEPNIVATHRSCLALTCCGEKTCHIVDSTQIGSWAIVRPDHPARVAHAVSIGRKQPAA
jgi:hypothetical protein